MEGSCRAKHIRFRSTICSMRVRIRRTWCCLMCMALGCRPAIKNADLPQAQPGASFTGIVRDSITPVSDVSVALYKESRLLGNAVTDKHGRFTFGTRPEDYYRIVVSSAGYASCTVTASFFPPQPELLIGVVPASDSARLDRQRAAGAAGCSCRLPLSKPRVEGRPSARVALSLPDPRRATIAVDVVDPEDHVGVGQAQVLLTPEPTTRLERIGALTDATGRAIFENIPPGKYNVLARRLGFVANRTEIVAVAGRIDSLTLPFKWDVSRSCIQVRTGQ